MAHPKIENADIFDAGEMLHQIFFMFVSATSSALKVGCGFSRKKLHYPTSTSESQESLPLFWIFTLDFTIITPTRSSFSISSTSRTTLMDQAAAEATEKPLRGSNRAVQAHICSVGGSRSGMRNVVHHLNGKHQSRRAATLQTFPCRQSHGNAATTTWSLPACTTSSTISNAERNINNRR